MVTSIYANCLTNATDWRHGWEIRSGITDGSGRPRSKLAARARSTQTATERSGFGFDEYERRVSGLAAALPPGTYFVGVNVGDLAGARAFVSSTSGANAVGTPPGNNGNSFL
ncbi:MAG: hypothetical protein H0W86_00525 [Armatimonadetes bacterium]|nr:hypothetical protein [Armatimonadota bacterium]